MLRYKPRPSPKPKVYLVLDIEDAEAIRGELENCANYSEEQWWIDLLDYVEAAIQRTKTKAARRAARARR